MRFILMAKAGSERAVPPNPELMAAIGKLTEEMTKKGILIDTGGLQPSSKGARLRLAGGKVTVTDGPFTEAKELIGGYAIVQVKSKEEAIELARQFLEIHADILGASYEAESEIRQMYDPSDFALEGR
jgi:hypothetical protein